MDLKNDEIEALQRILIDYATMAENLSDWSREQIEAARVETDRLHARLDGMRVSDAVWGLTETEMAELRTMRKIEAIKAVRYMADSHTGHYPSLIEAKNFVEQNL